jgi:hypothetical protein
MAAETTNLPPVKKLAEMCDYLRLPPVVGDGHGGLTIEVIDLAVQLNAWFQNTPCPEPPQASVAISRGALALFVNGECIWGSECDNSEELTLDHCLKKYRAIVLAAIAPFRMSGEQLHFMLDRRALLVDKKSRGLCSEEEIEELEDLQKQFGEYQDLVAPLPQTP